MQNLGWDGSIISNSKELLTNKAITDQIISITDSKEKSIEAMDPRREKTGSNLNN